MDLEKLEYTKRFLQALSAASRVLTGREPGRGGAEEAPSAGEVQAAWAEVRQAVRELWGEAAADRLVEDIGDIYRQYGRFRGENG